MTNQDVTMDGKVCMVTGATSGIGFITARELARLGATVILIGRHPERSKKAVQQIQQETKNSMRMRLTKCSGAIVLKIFSSNQKDSVPRKSETRLLRPLCHTLENNH